MEIVYHYPPELLNLLVDTIPLLCRSKGDVLLFFRGAGVTPSAFADLEATLRRDKSALNKFMIARTILSRLNDRGEASLGERRQVLRRVVEFDDFSTCWPDDQLKAKGLVAEIQKVVNVKDSFTRMRKERDQERQRRTAALDAEATAAAERRQRRGLLKQKLFSLFAMQNAQARGLALEGALNDLFAEYGLLVRESFRRVDVAEEGVLEQIDGVVEIDNELYLAEMKWLSRSVSVGDVSHHLVRIFTRGGGRGLFISVTEFSEPAISLCKDSLSQKVVVLCLLQEIVRALEEDRDLADMFRIKVRAAVIDKRPYQRL
jgi:restriction system protein